MYQAFCLAWCPDVSAQRLSSLGNPLPARAPPARTPSSWSVHGRTPPFLIGHLLTDVMLPSASLRLLPPGLLPSPAGALRSPGFPAHAHLYHLRGSPLQSAPSALTRTTGTSRGRGFLARHQI
ncbi:hypothetical protein DFH09DRAFT_1344094 [Mycena vulgaris]|nr:hypothetical protein DFH09DRAFT_1344094 [Mycena vulgaris]